MKKRIIYNAIIFLALAFGIFLGYKFAEWKYSDIELAPKGYQSCDRTILFRTDWSPWHDPGPGSSQYFSYQFTQEMDYFNPSIVCDVPFPEIDYKDKELEPTATAEPMICPTRDPEYVAWMWEHRSLNDQVRNLMGSDFPVVLVGEEPRIVHILPGIYYPSYELEFSMDEYFIMAANEIIIQEEGYDVIVQYSDGTEQHCQYENSITNNCDIKENISSITLILSPHD